MDIVRQSFRPEFVNRIDEVVVFHSLKKEQIRAIAELQIEFLSRRLAEQDLRLVMSTDALDRLGETGFDPVYGARPLKRAIQTFIETPLAQALLEGKFPPGAEIQVGTDGNGDYTFTGRAADAA
jgi:ATP-dependent Clp protease ATP-binding subunit ClpB